MGNAMIIKFQLYNRIKFVISEKKSVIYNEDCYKTTKRPYLRKAAFNYI